LSQQWPRLTSHLVYFAELLNILFPSKQKNNVFNLGEVQTSILLPSMATLSHEEVLLLERVQRRGSIFMPDNYIIQGLFQLNLLPLMYVLEFQDIL